MGVQIGSRNFHWVAGCSGDINDQINLITSGGVTGAPLNPPLTYPQYQGQGATYTRSLAGFLDGTLALTSTTDLTLGIRETADRVKFDSSTLFYPASGPPPFFTSFPQGDADSTKPTYRAILEQKFTPHVMGTSRSTMDIRAGASLSSARELLRQSRNSSMHIRWE